MKGKLLTTAALAAIFIAGPVHAQSDNSGSTLPKQQPSMNQPSGQGSENSAKEYAPGQQQGETAKENAPGQQTEGTAKENAPGQMKKKQTTESTGSTKKEKASDTTGTTKKKASEATGTTKKDDKSSTAGTSKETVGSKDKTKKQEATGESDTTGATGATGKAGKIDVPSDKRAEVRKSFTVKDVKRVNLDIDVSVGTHVPRDVVFYDVPATIIRIVPEFRGFKYFVLANGTIVIVDPDSYEVVYVMAA